MPAVTVTLIIGPEYVELKSNSNRPVSPGANSGEALTAISLFTLPTAPQSSAVAGGDKTTARTSKARANAGARMMRAEAARSSYRYRGVYRGTECIGIRHLLERLAHLSSRKKMRSRSSESC